jgi:hypothetical protein
MEREELRKQREEQERMEKIKDAEEQNRILEEAWRKMQEEEQQKRDDPQFMFGQWMNDQCCNLPVIGLSNEAINLLSKEKAEKYMASNEYRGLPCYEDLHFLYKIIVTSQEMLIAKLWMLPQQEINSFYRKCAMRLHPDKNPHPQAMEAFQKFHECYKVCINSKKN